MGQTINETPEEFLEMLKQAGVTVTNERELRERLAESMRWRYSFSTLVRNGQPLGIKFSVVGADKSLVSKIFEAYHVDNTEEFDKFAVH